MNYISGRALKPLSEQTKPNTPGHNFMVGYCYSDKLYPYESNKHRATVEVDIILVRGLPRKVHDEQSLIALFPVDRSVSLTNCFRYRRGIKIPFNYFEELDLALRQAGLSKVNACINRMDRSWKFIVADQIVRELYTPFTHTQHINRSIETLLHLCETRISAGLISFLLSRRRRDTVLLRYGGKKREADEYLQRETKRRKIVETKREETFVPVEVKYIDLNFLPL